MKKDFTISCVVPYMEIDEGKPAVLKRLVDSLVGYDELLVISNWKWGYAKPINLGLSIAKGDYLLVLNDDLKMDRGASLKDLCDPNYVTSPTIDGKEQDFWGCAFMIPRWVYEKVGGLDERYRISYFDDNDWETILMENNIPYKSMPYVNFWNIEGGGRTLHTFSDHNDFFAENKLKFIQKWGYEPIVIKEFYKKNHRLPKKGEVII